MFYAAESVRVSFMESICTTYGNPRCITRDSIYDSAIQLYQENMNTILNEFPFRVKFKGEIAIDSGGVSRDFCSAFWEAAYEKAFDGNTLLTPALHSGIDLESLQLIGSIISHMYLAVGFIPVRVAFPSLACIFIDPNVSIPSEIMIETFIDSLCAYEQDYVQSAVKISNDGGKFSEEQKKQLTAIFSRYGSRSIPSPDSLKCMILQASKYEFIVKPCAALTAIHSGIPIKHLAFWKKLSVYELHSLYSSLSVSPAKIISLLDGDDSVGNPNQERVFKYLTQFVGNMNNDELRSFLRFVTGSSVCPCDCMKVSFNYLTGIARRPIGHTCGCQLELSVDYQTYLEFVVEFRSYLHAKETWYMDAA